VANLFSLRDIKPENLLITKDGTLKLGSFDVSHIFWSTDILNQTVGTIAFHPPEMCKGGEFHGRDCDVWAMGCSLYCFTFGKVPFLGANTYHTYNQIVSKEPEFTRPINPQLEHLLRRILDKNPSTRITIKDLKRHPWVTKEGKEPLSTTLERIIVSETDIVESVTRLRKLEIIIGKITKHIVKLPEKLHLNHEHYNHEHPNAKSNDVSSIKSDVSSIKSDVSSTKSDEASSVKSNGKNNEEASTSKQ